MLRRAGFLFMVVVSLNIVQHAGAQCYVSYGGTENAKPNKLFLYFPTADDATYPTFGGQPTSPARSFDVSALATGIGTTAQLRDAIRDVVIADYCEFNVQVIPTLTNPDTLASPPARRVTVAIGSDSRPVTGGVLFGVAQPPPGFPNSPDVGNTVQVDYVRVWGGSYLTAMGGPGGALNGANSTLERWALGIGGTAAHEGGHNLGLQHGDDVTPRPGEDAFSRHVMPAGTTLTNEQRVGFRRHFSDTTFGILAANVGLSVQTVHNWDYTNPNSAAASRLQMEILSTASTLTLGWAYTGARSPWTTPVVAPLGLTTTFQGTVYNRFTVTWSTGQAWSNSGVAPFEPAGVVGPGLNFHVGAEFVGVDFNTPNPIIVRNVTLLNSSGTALPLHPRMAAYDAGNLDIGDGTFRVRLFNADGGPPLEIRNIVVQELPRVLSIESMMAGQPMLTWDELPVKPWREKSLPDATLRDKLAIDIAPLKQGHNVFINHDRQPRPPNPVGAAADTNVAPETSDQDMGIDVDLFPATTVYVTMTVVDPDAEHWDPAQGRIVRGPVESKLFYQFRGITPDLNHNGKDDAIDIATGTSTDANGDGVPDDAVRKKAWWLYGFVGPFRFDNALPFDDGTVYGFRVGKRHGVFAIEGELGVTPTDGIESTSGKVYQASINARRFFGATSTVQPFVMIGAGALRFAGFFVDDTCPAANAGVGFELPFASKYVFRAEARDMIAFDAYGTGTTHNPQVTAGFGVRLP